MAIIIFTDEASSYDMTSIASPIIFQYRDATDDNIMDLGSDSWIKARQALQSNSDSMHEPIIGKKITFSREGDGTRDLMGDMDDHDGMRSPAREKVVATKKLPTAQVKIRRKWVSTFFQEMLFRSCWIEKYFLFTLFRSRYSQLH